ncbi:hypothetical protein K0T92_14680 [Paenibacillus oenotherae]|uniref:Uncharacterized protein n=1 Tax=Paenibacillus oenotherae TaxID=1435645 RepID=A0ABS7D846_9BACL|nr:hypothetical protein [Paenibacillus oenotherae]MBW7475989.1 hypothetical protein [Paenibacillus oenotherae]
MSWSKIMRVLITFAFVILLVYCWLFYQERAANTRNFQTFSSSFYNKVDSLVLTIDKLLEGGNSGLASRLNELENKLIKTDLTLYQGYSFLNDSIYYSTYFEMLNNMIHGIHADGPATKVVIPPFDEDSRLDESEINYLKLMRDQLNGIRQAMLDKATGQARGDIGINEFNEILKPITIEDIYSFYRKAQEMK